MIIVTKKEVPLSELKSGDCFMFNDQLYIRTDEQYGDNEHETLCINLSNGCCIGLSGTTLVLYKNPVVKID
jgi:hypothetical protein